MFWQQKGQRAAFRLKESLSGGGAVEEEQRLVTSFKETPDQKTSAVLLEMAPVCIEGGKMGGGLLNNGSAEMSGCFRRLVIGRKGEM